MQTMRCINSSRLPQVILRIFSNTSSMTMMKKTMESTGMEMQAAKPTS
jgi:hypothetical protein